MNPRPWTDMAIVVIVLWLTTLSCALLMAAP